MRLDSHGRPLLRNFSERKWSSIHDSKDLSTRPRRKDHQPMSSCLSITSLILRGPLIPFRGDEFLHSCRRCRIAVWRNVLVLYFVSQLLKEVIRMFHSVVADVAWHCVMCCVVSSVCPHLGH